jgi:hypothetical protein
VPAPRLSLVRKCGMAQVLAESSRAHCRDVWNFLLTLPFFAILLAGCNNACFIFTSNPPTGTININADNSGQTCRLTKANAAVRILAHTVSPCSPCSPSTRIAHVFVSLHGIEVHAGAIADDTLADWQELVPQYAAQPRQFDLMSPTAGRETRLPLGERVTISADVYRHLRLRFVPNQPTSDDPVPQKNACGSAGFNCVVSEDGRSYPLLLDGTSGELRMKPDITGGFLLIPPDSDSNLVIEFNVSWSLSSHAGEGLLPVLIGKVSLERPLDTPP